MPTEATETVEVSAAPVEETAPAAEETAPAAEEETPAGGEIQIFWAISNTRRNLDTGIIEAASYVVEATNGVYRQTAQGTQNFPARDPEGAIPYADVTQDVVCGWVREALNAEQEGAVDQIHNALAARVLEQSTPTVGFGLPWA